MRLHFESGAPPHRQPTVVSYLFTLRASVSLEFLFEVLWIRGTHMFSASSIRRWRDLPPANSRSQSRWDTFRSYVPTHPKPAL
jgi:hypothetical protein